MPKGKWTPPDAGDAPAEVKHILKVAYSQYRDKHPAENPATKMKGAKIAWGAVHAAGWSNKSGKWVKKGAKEMAEEIIIDAFKEGEYPQGKFTAKELSEIQSTYNPENYEAPILIGHLSDPAYKGKSAIPAFGWIGKVKVVGDHLKLVASQFSEQLKDFIKQGFYKKVSAAFFQPQDPNNPTPGKWHLHHLAFLGGAAPAVKGLEQIAFAEMKGLGLEFAEMETEVSVDGEVLDVAEEMGMKDTLDDMAECCATFMKKCEEALNSEADLATAKGRINLALSDMSTELSACVNQHFSFIEKLEKIDEMSEKKSWLLKFTELLTHKRKESAMDAQEKQEYELKIADLDKKVKEFEEKERVAAEAKAKAEQEAQEAAQKTEDEKRVNEIKAFCEETIKAGKMTPAMREKDEPIMLSLAKTPDALKSFQEKYSAVVVPVGELPDLNKPPEKPKGKLDLAADFVAANPKEFAGLSPQDAVARAVWLEGMGKIKF